MTLGKFYPMPSKKKLQKSELTFKQVDQLQGLIEDSGIYLIEFADCYLERIFLNKIEGKYKKVYGPELTSDWIENELFSVGLFGSEGPFVCLLSESLSSKFRDKLKEKIKARAENEGIFDDIKILFLTNQKFSDKFIIHEFPMISITGPKFWEMADYFDVLAKSLDLSLSREVKDYLLGALVPSAHDFYSSLQILKSYPATSINLQLVKDLLKVKKLDNFELADFFNQKNMKRIYRQLLLMENDFDSYRDFFTFMQGHIIKIMDTNHLRDKLRLNKYEQGISRATTKWTIEDLKGTLENFLSWEILCKKKSDRLRDELRQKYLES